MALLRPTIINLAATMLPKKHTSASLHPTAGQEFIQTSFDTQKLVSAANKENHPQTSHRHSNPCRCRPTQHPHPRGPLWPHAGRRTPTQIHFVHQRRFHEIHFVHHRCFHEIHFVHHRRFHENCGQGHFSKWFCKFGIPDSHRWQERVC